MSNTKTYKLVINGLTESINAVESLNKQLDALEQKMKTLSSAKVSTGGGNSTRANAALSEEEQILKEINNLKQQGAQLDAKIAAAQDEVYKRVDATKQLYKETIADQKALAAAERLQADAYSNTMQGMKSKLADLKAVINTTDLGDGDSIKKMTKEANDLNNQIKKIEESYGQFGRNVGNYANGVAEGLNNVIVSVGGTERIFNSAKEAARTLGNELKNMAVNGQQDTEEFKNLQQAVAQLNSDIKDATVSSKAMDNLLDTMESFAAIGSISKGFSALFGFDDTEIQKSIQQLVALQNAMQGIEKINKQIQTQEGIGGWIAKGNSMIDSFVAKLTGAAKAQQEVNAANKAGTVASQALATAEEAQAVATTKVTFATKALSVALKSIGIGLLVSAIAYLVSNWEDLYKWLTDTVPALKNIGTWFDKVKAVVIGVGGAVVNYLIQPIVTFVKVFRDLINLDFKQAGNDIINGFKKTFNVVGNFQKSYYGEVEKQQQAHNKKMNEQQKKSNEEWLKDEEAKYGQSHKRTQEYLKKQMSLTEEGSDEYKELQRKLWEDERREREEASKKSTKTVTDSERELIQARINSMKEGLNKTITQLEEERKTRLSKLNENSKEYQEWTIYYDDRILEEKDKWAKQMVKVYDDMWMKIKADSLQNSKDVLQLMEASIENGRENMQKGYEVILGQGISSYGVQAKNQLSPMTQFSLGWELTLNQSDLANDIKQYIDLMREAQIAENEYQYQLFEFNKKRNELTDDEIGREQLKLGHYESIYKQRKRILKDYENSINKLYGEEQVEATKLKLIDENYSSDLTTLFKQRITAVENYWQERIAKEAEFANGLALAQKQALKDQYDYDLETNKKHWNEMLAENNKAYHNEVEGIKVLEKQELIATEEAERQILEAKTKWLKAYAQITNNYAIKEKELNEKYAADSIKIENDRINKIKQLNKQSYQDRLQELRDFQTALSDLESKQPVMTSFGFTALQKTFDNNKALLSGYENLAKKITDIRAKANKDIKDGLISQDTYDNTIRELDRFSAQLGEKMDEVKQKMSFTAQAQVLVSEISQYASQLGSALNSMLQAFSDYTDQQYENAINDIEKQIDEIQKLYDKQEEIVESHRDKLNDIEDELATSRGDRRQHLIDQLNAEMQAQRNALAEEKRLEKDRKALEAQKDAEERDRKIAQQKMAVTQAIINGATAFMNALSQQPIWLGLALSTMVAAMTAAQVATINSQKYAKGGQLDGKSHAQGGIKVPGIGGGIELEGKEYVIRKKTTTKNIDLLDYINRSERKLSLDDFIDFYGGKVKKNVSSISPVGKYANGGVLPVMSTNIDINDRLISAFEDYANTPVVVSVVDINNRQAAVRNVRVLAGLNE